MCEQLKAALLREKPKRAGHAMCTYELIASKSVKEKGIIL